MGRTQKAAGWPRREEPPIEEDRGPGKRQDGTSRLKEVCPVEHQGTQTRGDDPAGGHAKRIPRG